MGQRQSKDESLYHQVRSGNADRITALCREGAGLEWTDKGGKTPLMVACMSPKLYDTAKTLIELGADVNKYRRGCEGGTPLHHAAKQGLEQTVQLLLSHGANALVVNDDGRSALDVARIKGHANVVRTIESHLCLFSGWLREPSVPVFLESLGLRLLSREVWVVVLPCGSRTLRKPFKLELAIYTTLQDARPCSHFALWQANLEEPNTNQPDPAVIISDTSTKIRIKLAPINEKENQQLQRFCDACKGIPQVFHWNFPFNIGAPILIASAQHVISAAPINTLINSVADTSGNNTQFAPPDAGPSASFSCQLESLKKKVEDQDVEIQKLQEFAAQETSKCSFAKEVINSVAIQLREMTETLPPELLSSESYKDMHSQVEAFLSTNNASVSGSHPSVPAGPVAQRSRQDGTSSVSDSANGRHHRSSSHLDIAGGNLLPNGEDTPRASNRESSSLQRSDSGSSSSTSRSEGQKEVIEQFEPGVYVTLLQFPNGTKVFKRVRFSKRRFAEQQAEEWWRANKDRLLRKYTLTAANGTQSAGASTSGTAPGPSSGASTSGTAPGPSEESNGPTSSS